MVYSPPARGRDYHYYYYHGVRCRDCGETVMAKPRKLYDSGGNVVMSLSASMRAAIGVESGDYVAVEEQDDRLIVAKAELGVDPDE
jgi:DNA-directed RNA polymerase subunit RPC12/RpoP